MSKRRSAVCIQGCAGAQPRWWFGRGNRTEIKRDMGTLLPLYNNYKYLSKPLHPAATQDACSMELRLWCKRGQELVGGVHAEEL